MDQLIRSWVHVRGSFVQYEYGVVPNDGSRQADQLPLADLEIGAALVDVGLQAYLFQLDLLEDSPQLVVIVQIERIEIPF